MDFSSDTSAPAHPKVLEALARANTGSASSYGADAETAALEVRLKEVFETAALRVWPVASGTAANALALSVLCPPTGAVICHEMAHIARDERGAPEFFTGGGKLQLLPGAHGQIDRTALSTALGAINPGFVHETPAAVLSLTNLTESGTAYFARDIADMAAQAHDAGLSTHLDGARLANALATTRATPRAMTWQAGIDVLTLGLTKTGAMGCELIILFGEHTSHYDGLAARAKRAGHMPAKLRFLSAQANAMLEDGLWLKLAKTANQHAKSLAETLCQHTGVNLREPVDGNEVFIDLPTDMATRLNAGGAKFYPWPDGGYRFVCSWATQDQDIANLAKLF